MYSQAILEKIQAIPEGEPFDFHNLLETAPRSAIKRSLSSLTRSGVLMRVARGIYVRPEISEIIGRCHPDTEKVVRFIASGETISITGAEAAQRLGLSTQMVLKRIYLTSGRSRKIKLESGREIILRHAPERKLALAERPAGVALVALFWMGKNEVTNETIKQIRERIPPEEFEVLKKEAHVMPAWMREKVVSMPSMGELFRRISEGKMSRREFEEATGREWWWGDILVELGKRGLPHPIVEPELTDARRKLLDEIF